MGRFKLESYRGRSMESGPSGWEGLIRAEEDGGAKVYKVYIDAVPEGTENDVLALKDENSLVTPNGVSYNLEEEVTDVIGEGEDEWSRETYLEEEVTDVVGEGEEERSRETYLEEEVTDVIGEGEDEFIRSIETSSYYQSMSMSDMAKEVTKGIDVPTAREVQSVDDLMFGMRKKEEHTRDTEEFEPQ